MNKPRIKRNAATTAANITYYGGTIGAALAFQQALNDNSALATAVLVVFILTVEGLLRTLLDEVLDTPRKTPDTAQAKTADTTT